MTGNSGALLCVANYPTNVGYAWDFIEGLFAHLADHLATHGHRTFVAYPQIDAPPRSLAGSAAQPVLLDASLSTRASVRAAAEFVHREQVKTVYLTDRAPWSLAYWHLRCAGARCIVVHDHTSGARQRPTGIKRWGKWLMARAPWVVADRVLTVSDYVARRQLEVGQLSPGRVLRIHNGLTAPAAVRAPDGSLQRTLGVLPERPVVLAASRAVREKGIAHLLRAFDRLTGRLPVRPLLVYAGDGPQLPELRELRESLASKDDIVLTGYRQDAATLVEGATLCVVPSVWQEAFGNSVLEAPFRARPVIATRVGGIPEMIEDGVTGLLVEPGDEAGLAEAMHALLTDPARAEQLGQAARCRAIENFSPEEQIWQLAAEMKRGFGTPCPAVLG